MDGFLIKPFDDRQLAEALMPVLARSQSADRRVGSRRAITTAPETTDAPVIDMGVLDRLRTLGRPNGPSPLRRAVVSFVDVAPSLARDMRESFETAEAEQLWRSAHSLKSSSGALGAIALARHCAQIEALARQSNLAAVRPLMGGLDGGVAAAVEQLQAIAGDVHVPA